MIGIATNYSTTGIELDSAKFNSQSNKLSIILGGTILQTQGPKA